MHTLDAFTLIFFAFAVLMYFGGSLWMLLEGFRKNILWGIAMLFVPFSNLAFVITNWNRAAKPFLMVCTSFAICGIMFLTNQHFRDALHAESQKNQIADNSIQVESRVPRTATPAVSQAAPRTAAVHHTGKHHHSKIH